MELTGKGKSSVNNNMQQNEAQMTPRQHAHWIAHMLQEAQNECRADIERVDDPKAQALFETLAEVLGGAIKALDDYSGRAERVWQEAGYRTHVGTQSPTVTNLAVDVDAAEPPPELTKVLPHSQEKLS